MQATLLESLILVGFRLSPIGVRCAEPGEATVTPRVMHAKHRGEEHFKAGDATKDGFFDPVELTTTRRKQTRFTILSKRTEACFTRLDTNGDGKLDAAEYRKVSRMPNHAEQHFKSADTDKNGFLHQAEFTTHAAQKLQALDGSDPNVKSPKK